MGMTKKGKFIKDTNDLYRAYGRFAVEFKQLGISLILSLCTT